ncbi:potassium channel family protein [Stetteria hydrogenophila]
MKILIIGAGSVGSILAEELSEAGHSVTVVDKNEERIARLSQSQYDVEPITRDATDPSLYEEIQIDSFDVVVAATDRDEVNLFVAAIAKMKGVEKIYVRVRNPQTARMLEMLGIRGVIPEPQLAAKVLYSFIQGSYTLVNLIPAFAGDYMVVGLLVRPTSPIRGKPVEEVIDELNKHGSRLLVIYDNESAAFYEPSEVSYINDDMLLIVLAPSDAVREISKLV